MADLLDKARAHATWSLCGGVTGVLALFGIHSAIAGRATFFVAPVFGRPWGGSTRCLC